jgi:hypothetical protein
VKLKSLKIDSAAVEGGRWVEQIPGAGNLRLRVRGVGNAAYRALMDKLVDAVPREKRLRGLDVADRDRITAECFVETILLDWDNLYADDAETEKVPYSKELASQLLTDPDYIRFYDAVQWAANLVANDSEADLKEAEGNS